MRSSERNRARRAGVAAAMGTSDGVPSRARYPHSLPLRRVWIAAYERTICRQNMAREMWWAIPGFTEACNGVVDMAKEAIEIVADSMRGFADEFAKDPTLLAKLTELKKEQE